MRKLILALCAALWAVPALADSTLTALPAASALTGAELFYGVQASADVKVTAAQISAFVGAAGVPNPLTLTRLLTITQSQANEGVLASAGYSLTGSNATNMIDLAGTWNTSGNPTAFKIAITDTADGGSALMMNLLGGAAGTTSLFSVNKGGDVSARGVLSSSSYIIFGPGNYYLFPTAIRGNANSFKIANNAGGYIGLVSSVGVVLGDADLAAPVAQTLSVQSVVAGNANTAGVDWNFVGSLSNGSGAAGKIKFGLSQISAASGSQNASTVVLSLNTITASGIQFPTYGAGALSTDASGNITATSDERLKHVLGHFDAGLAELELIQPIIYKWTSGSGMETEHEYAGLGAGNVRDAIPEAVGETRDGYLTLSDRAIIAAEINAIKELAGELSAVKAEQGRIEQHLWYMEMKR